MKRNLIQIIFMIFLIGLSQVGTWAQTAEQDLRSVLEGSVGTVVRVRTEGRGEFQGILMIVGDDRVEVKDHEGLILEIAISDITSVLRIETTDRKETYYQDAAANKLILMPVGFGMDPGEFHIADQEIVIVSSSYGFSEHFSLWGAMSIPGALVNVRLSTAVGDRIGLSTGSFAGIFFFESGQYIFIPYVIGSVGTPNQNITVGLGVPTYLDTAHEIPITAEEDRLTTYAMSGGVLALGGKVIISETASIVTENWILVMREYWDNSWQKPGVYVVPSVAFRIAGSRYSWDVGIVMGLAYAREKKDNTDEMSVGADFERTYGPYGFRWLTEVPIPIPVLNFTYRIQ